MNIEPEKINDSPDKARDGMVKDWQVKAGDAAGMAVKAVSAELERTQASIEAGLCDARTRINDARIAAGLQVRHAAGLTQAYVSENPWKAIAVAATVGLAAALLIRRH